MSAHPTPSRLTPQPSRTSTRIQFLEYQSAPEHREYRLVLHTPEGSAQVRLRIALDAFVATRVLLQDGPDVCYQFLERMVAAGETPGTDVLTIGAAELAAYREAHTPAPRRSAPHNPHPTRPLRQRTVAPPTHPKLPVAPPPVASETQSAFDEGQRVRHAVYGAGVTMGSSGGHTSVQFDEHGVRTFVTSMLELQTLSAPRKWLAGPRGKNRPRDADPAER